MQYFNIAEDKILVLQGEKHGLTAWSSKKYCCTIFNYMEKVACSKNLRDLVMIMMTELVNLRTTKEKVSLTTENGQKPCSRNWNWFGVLTWKRAEHEKVTRSFRNISRLNLNLDKWETTAQLYSHTDCHRRIIGAFPGEMNESIITTKEILRKTYLLISEGFLSETMKNHEAAGKETDHLNSS